MFGLFKKRIHEPEELQHRDLDGYPEEFRKIVMAGEGCDALLGASGDFGRCSSNPIPVNGMLGTFKYFFKLRTNAGSALLFHRIGSVKSTVAPNLVDVYETVSMDAACWDVFFFDFYHPRRSNLTPSGYKLLPYDKRPGDLPFAFGTDKQLRDFPQDLPAILEKSAHLGEPFARRVRERLVQSNFRRPSEHVTRLRSMQVTPSHVTIVDPKSGDVLRMNPTRQTRPLRVVVVDDDPQLLELYVETFRLWFGLVEFVPFDKPLKALEELEQRDPDLLITGDRMPRMGGEQLVQRLMARNINYPILVLTANTQAQQWVEDYDRRGFKVGYQKKPGSERELEGLRSFIEKALHITRGLTEKPTNVTRPHLSRSLRIVQVNDEPYVLVPRPPGALEKAVPGAKRILSGMVLDTLALAKKDSPQKPTFTALLGKDHFAGMMELSLEWKLGATHSLKFFYFSRSSELMKLAEEHPFDLVFMYLGNINWDAGSRDGLFNGAADVLGELKARYGKPIVATQGMDLSAEFEPRGVIFLNAPFVLDDLWARLQPQLVASVGSKDAVKFPRNAGQGDQTSKTRPLRIVSVDDEDWRLELVEVAVSTYFKGVSLQSFRDADEAWQELLRIDPDLLITDDIMGKLNGEEIVHRLADRKITYPVIVINGYGPERDQWVSDCAKRGMNITMLRAPYDLERLLMALETGLKISRNTKAPSKVATQARKTRPPRIVVMDDEPFCGEAIKMVIEYWWTDATVLTFTEAEAAMQELLREEPDLFTTDWNHTKIPCADMLSLLAERKVAYPIFVISASAEWLLKERILDEFRNKGLDVTLLTKPFTVEELHRELQKHLGAGKLSTQLRKSGP